MNSTTFRTEIKLSPAHSIGLRDQILTTGSCFADQFGGWLRDFKFNTLVNPFGTTYNPISIHQNLIEALNSSIDENGYVEHQGIWHHFEFHSQWSSPEKTTLQESISNQQKKVNDFLRNTSVLIITYGTAFIYEQKNNNKIVSNCHKLPSALFTKRLLIVNEITESFATLIKKLRNVKPDIRIIVTVSPVRHVKDTLELNSVSKATLRLACHKLASNYDSVDYFPSFEIMMDDMRDYRFYERDQIHPTEEAVDYIINKFSDKYFSSDTVNFIQKWYAIRKALQHRAYHPHSQAHQHFLKDLLQKLKALQSTVNVDEEINFVESQLVNNA